MADQSQQGGMSIADIIATAKTVWQVFLIPAALATWGALRWITNRKDSREDAERAERDKVRASLGVRETAFMDRIEKELGSVKEDLAHERRRTVEIEAQRAESDKQRNEAYRQCDKGWDIARGWKMRAHIVRHDLNNARMIINALRIKTGMPEIAWPMGDLPPLEDIIPFNEDEEKRRTTERSTPS